MNLEMVYSKQETLEFNTSFINNLSSFFDEHKFIFVNWSLDDFSEIIKVEVHYSNKYNIWYSKVHTYNKIKYCFGEFNSLNFMLAETKSSPLTPDIIFNLPISVGNKSCEAIFVKMGDDVHLMSKIYNISEKEYSNISSSFECSIFQLEDDYSLLDWGSISGDSFINNLKYYLDTFNFEVSEGKLDIVYSIDSPKLVNNEMDINMYGTCDICGNDLIKTDSEYLIPLSSKFPNKCKDCLEKIFSLKIYKDIRNIVDSNYFNLDTIKEEFEEGVWNYSLGLLLKLGFIKKLTGKFYRLYEINEIIDNYSKFLDESSEDNINNNFNPSNSSIGDISLLTKEDLTDELIVDVKEENISLINIRIYLDKGIITFRDSGKFIIKEFENEGSQLKNDIINYLNKEFNILSINYIDYELNVGDEVSESLDTFSESDSEDSEEEVSDVFDDSKESQNNNSLKILEEYLIKDKELIILVDENKFDEISIKFIKTYVDKWYVAFKNEGKFYKQQDFLDSVEGRNELLEVLNGFKIIKISFDLESYTSENDVVSNVADGSENDVEIVEEETKNFNTGEEIFVKSSDGVEEAVETPIVEKNRVNEDFNPKHNDNKHSIFPSLPGTWFNSNDLTWSFVISNKNNVDYCGSFGSEEEAFDARIKYLLSYDDYGFNPQGVCEIPKIRSDGKFSRFKGISFDLDESKWFAKFNDAFLGFFDSEDNARKFWKKFQYHLPVPKKNDGNMYSYHYKVTFHVSIRQWVVLDPNGKVVYSCYSEEDAFEFSKDFYSLKYKDDLKMDNVKSEIKDYTKERIYCENVSNCNKNIFYSNSNVFLKGIVTNDEFNKLCAMFIGPNLNQVICKNMGDEDLLFDVLFDLEFGDEKLYELDKNIKILSDYGWKLIV